MELIGVVITICAVIATMKKEIYGICIFMAVRVLIPESVRFIIGSISLNTAIILCVTIVILLKKFSIGKVIIDMKSYPIVLVWLGIYFAISLLVSNVGNITSQYSRLIQFVITDILPAMILFRCMNEEENIVFFVKTFLVTSLLCCIYGLLVVLMKGANPYVVFWTGESTYLTTWKGVSTSSTFVSNNTFGYYLTIAFPFCVYIYNVYYKKKWVRFLLFLQILCIFFTKKRAAFICLVAYAIMYFWHFKHCKKMRVIITSIGLALLGLLFIYLLPQFEAVKNYLISSLFFWNDKAVSGLSNADLGSSWALRIRQLVYPYTEIKDNLLFGHGFGWCAWYIDKYKLHWPLYGFETIFSSAICEYGIMGYVVYFVIFYSGYKYSRYSSKIKDNYPLYFILTVLLMAIATGFNYYYLYFSLIVVMNALRNVCREKAFEHEEA